MEDNDFLVQYTSYLKMDGYSGDTVPEPYIMISRIIKDKFKNENRPFSIIDLGCGTGMLLKYITINRPNVKVIGVDINSEKINIAKKENNGDFYEGDVTAITHKLRPLYPHNIDLVILWPNYFKGAGVDIGIFNASILASSLAHNASDILFCWHNDHYDIKPQDVSRLIHFSRGSWSGSNGTKIILFSRLSLVEFVASRTRYYSFDKAVV